MGEERKREIERETGTQPKDVSEQSIAEIVKAGIAALKKEKSSEKKESK